MELNINYVPDSSWRGSTSWKESLVRKYRLPDLGYQIFNQKEFDQTPCLKDLKYETKQTKIFSSSFSEFEWSEMRL